MTAEIRPSLTALLRNPGYRRYFTGQSVSFFGDGIVPVTFALATLQLTRSGWGMPLVLLGLWVSRTLCIAVGGAAADRRDRATVMMTADIVRLAAQGAVALAFAFHIASMWQLVVSAAVYGAATAFFAPASVGLIPRLVPQEQIQRANSLLGSARNVGLLVGPALAALMVSTAGVRLALGFDVATFGVSVIALAGLRQRPETASVASENADGRGPESDDEDEDEVRFRDALPVLLTMRTVVWIVATWCVSQIAVASINVLGPIISRERLGGSDRWAVLVTSMAVGGLAGSALAGWLRVRRPLIVILPLLVFPMAVQLSALSLRAALPVLACCFVVTSAALAICGVLFDTYLQQTVPDRMLSRVSSAEYGLTSSMIPVGLAISYPVAKVMGTDAYLTALASVLLAVAAVGTVVISRGAGGSRAVGERHDSSDTAEYRAEAGEVSV